MDQENKLNSREKFLKIYENLPSKAREEVVYVTQDQTKLPYSWNAVYTEVITNTPLSISILSYLEKLSII